MKTIFNFVFSLLFLCLITSCEDEKSTCAEGNSNEEFIEWSFDDETFVLDFDHVDVYFADNRILNIYPISPELMDGPYENFWIKYDVLEESAHFSAGSFTEDKTFIGTNGDNLEMAVSPFSSKGDLICIQFDNGEFSGELRVVLDNIVKSGRVQGKVWLDENRNGINEADEDPLANVYLHLQTNSETLEEGKHDVYPLYYPTYGIKTDDNGRFTFNGVFVNYPIHLGFVTREDNHVTSANVGNDDTVDSDFNFSYKVNNRNVYTSDPFTLEEGSIKKDFGLGLFRE